MFRKSLVLLTLLITITVTGCSSMSDLDKSLYGAVNGVGGRDRVTGARTLNLSTRAAMIADKNAEMDQAFAEFRTKGGKLNAELDPTGYARIQKIVNRILSVSHFSSEQAQWKVFLLPDTTFNAFVNGGSYIMVHKGLLDQLKSDDEVAAVIGHEIGHNAANHIGESSTYQTVAMVTGSSSIGRSTFQQSFTMTQEAEADRIGILYAALAGYDPYAASKVWERMYAAEGNQTIISNHPLNRDRTAQTQQIADKVKAYYTPGKTNPNAAELIVNNTLWSQQADVVQAGSGGGAAALAETVLNTYLTRQKTKATEKTQQLHAQKVANVLQALKLISASAINADTLQTTFLYQGSIPLKVLAMAASTDKLRVVSHATPPISPGQQFTLTFQAPGLGQQPAQSVKFSLDDADY